MRKHRAWGSFLREVPLVCVEGVSAKQAGDRSSPLSVRVSVRRGGSGPSSPFAGVGSMGPFCLGVSQTQVHSGSLVLDFG